MKTRACFQVLLPAVAFSVFSSMLPPPLQAQECDLYVYKWSNAWDPVWVGEPLVYHLEYGNYTFPGVDAEDVELEDVLPPGLAYVSSDPPAEYDPGSRKVTWSLGKVPIESGGSVSIETVVEETAGRKLLNEARISTTTPDNNPENNTSYLEIRVGHAGECDAWVAKWSQPSDEVSPGETLEFLFHYGNGRLPAFALASEGGFQGEGSPAENVRVVDFLPEGTRYVSSDPPGNYDPVTHTVTWELGTVPWNGLGGLD